MNPRFITWDEALAIHADQIGRYGGTPGLRDEGLLRSALAQPEASFGGEWLHPTLADMAAAYMYHLAQNHPFVDGNKRVATVCGLHFLHLNGQTIVADQDAFADIILAIAGGRAGKDDLATWLRAHLQTWKGPRQPG
ncbi:MAG TPA: type II toxin-antitoxin system death-on-curing family toxin [Planctomycetes bacterium]|nr:type II toxin-antitoxin system death-on-curing family toxin [Planctomycetota bacterium]